VNPGFGHGHSRKTNTGGEWSKHGIWHAYLDEALRHVEKYRLDLVGLHMHIGSGADFEHLRRVCDAMVEQVRALGVDVRAISGGGGLPIPYRPATRRSTPRRCTRSGTTRAARRGAGRAPVSLEIEPGRYLVAESGALVTRVRATKREGPNRFVIVDAGFNDLARPVMYGAYHAIDVIGRAARSRRGRRSPTVVAGPLCESGDVFTQEDGGVVVPRDLPDAAVGDLVVIRDAGAYASSMASNYNTRPLAPEILVDARRCRADPPPADGRRAARVGGVGSHGSHRERDSPRSRAWAQTRCNAIRASSPANAASDEHRAQRARGAEAAGGCRRRPKQTRCYGGVRAARRVEAIGVGDHATRRLGFGELRSSQLTSDHGREATYAAETRLSRRRAARRICSVRARPEPAQPTLLDESRPSERGSRRAAAPTSAGPRSRNARRRDDRTRVGSAPRHEHRCTSTALSPRVELGAAQVREQVVARRVARLVDPHREVVLELEDPAHSPRADPSIAALAGELRREAGGPVAGAGEIRARGRRAGPRVRRARAARHTSARRIARAARGEGGAASQSRGSASSSSGTRLDTRGAANSPLNEVRGSRVLRAGRPQRASVDERDRLTARARAAEQRPRIVGRSGRRDS
jgi:hypothetical protein